MKVEIISEDNLYDLKQEINKRLKNHKNEDIIDIKYQGVWNHSTYSVDRPSAMIIYK